MLTDFHLGCNICTLVKQKGSAATLIIFMANNQAKFLNGSIFHHIIKMSMASSVALLALFMVDLVDMYFIGLLGETQLAAAIGYAGTILFFTTSISIGIAIGAGSIVAQCLGRNDLEAAKRYATTVYFSGALFAVFIVAILYPRIPILLDYLGAKGLAHVSALQYLNILIPSMPIIVIAMSCNAVIRAKGMARQSMWVLISGSIANAILDPIFIFGFDLGIQGAAIASVCSRITMLVVGLYYAVHIHQMFKMQRINGFFSHLPTVLTIAVPAMLTNIATPVGNAFVTHRLAAFGDSAIAAMSIVGRVVPVCFVLLFALSGAIGPIIGQNFGARQYQRVEHTIKKSIVLCFFYVLIMSLVLYFCRDMIVSLFRLTPESAHLIRFYCQWITLTFVFTGIQFVCNATFNNIGLAKYSTLANFAKASIGTVPFIYIGGWLGGAKGVLVGQALGTVLIACLTLYFFRRAIQSMDERQLQENNKEKRFIRRFPLWPFSSPKL